MIRLNIDMQLLDQMSEGVILLNRQAQVLAHNAASKAWVQRCKEKCDQLRRLIDQVVQGRVELPARVSLFAKTEAADAPPAEAWLCRNGLSNYAIFLSPQRLPAVNPELVEKRFISLLGDDARQHMLTLRDLLRDKSGDAEQREQAILGQSELVDILLQEISELTVLLQHEMLIDDTRIEVDELLRQLLPTLQTKHNNPYVFHPGSKHQGVLFGNGTWLTYALRVLLQALGASAPPGGDIDIKLHQMGGFIVLTGTVTEKRTVGVAATHAADPSVAAVANTMAHQAAAQMMVCKRIIALHSGQLKLSYMPSAGANQQQVQPIESFVLTMATGVLPQQKTASCAECPIALQAQVYAMDMATMLSQ